MTAYRNYTVCRRMNRGIKRPTPGEGIDVVGALRRELVQCSTGVGDVQAMMALQKAGYFNGAEFKPHQLARGLTKAKTKHAETLRNIEDIKEQRETTRSIWKH